MHLRLPEAVVDEGLRITVDYAEGMQMIYLLLIRTVVTSGREPTLTEEGNGGHREPHDPCGTLTRAGAREAQSAPEEYHQAISPPSDKGKVDENANVTLFTSDLKGHRRRESAIGQ
ncbi:unnamed protein product [Dibothriocephalus latus]|uniref:Uncharacterized protein n=1 Tax=Dibothriocephalus latus TaxID=60516 RepID=A0A3P7LFY1_DIBLA|nr:unnamed protein product [Dibothriocephalus latus]